LIILFLDENIEKVEKWFNWYWEQLEDQNEKGTFKWWYIYDKSNYGYLGTGLDDYPRILNEKWEKYSLDL